MTNLHTTTDDQQYDNRHGSPFDRGSADAYYGRPIKPHYYVGKTGSSKLVSEAEMSKEEIEAYLAGFNQQDDFKDWGM